MSYEPLGYGDRWYHSGFRPLASEGISKIIPAVLAIGLIACTCDAVSNFQIAKRQKFAVAVVIAHHPHNHGTYDLQIPIQGYSYTVKEINFDRGFLVNERVPVFFDPRAPHRVSLTSFADKAEGDMILTSLLFLEPDRKLS